MFFELPYRLTLSTTPSGSYSAAGETMQRIEIIVKIGILALWKA